jgi:(p)ppGpp synthase/HD superfamily hydrolase
MPLTYRFQEALDYAFSLHHSQKRKGTEIPYIAHLLGVTAIVLEAGGDEDQAIAALLHDAVEDQGGMKTLETIRNRFGDRVARIVDGCTDAYQTPKPPWRERKERYLQRLPSEPEEVRLVSLADKLHNARSIVTDLHQNGDKIYDRFRGGKKGTLWYYRSLVQFFNQAGPRLLAEELAKTVGEMEALSAE